MTALTDQSWFWWAVGIVVGLPVILFLLSEVLTALQRSGSPMARPVALVRNYVVPSAALFLLLTRAADVSVQVPWVRVVATVFGFVLLIAVLSALNIAVFTEAEPGSWRSRMPSIFVDIFRLVLVVAGLAMLFSWVWGADVAGLFTALGVTSIVLGFALQNAVGSIISGLLLLFEQPFKLGDWLDTGTARGRVVEVNWRAVHLDTGEGIRITPNAALAGSSFVNLSRPVGPPAVVISTVFPVTDPPDQVCRLLEQVATDIGGRNHAVAPVARAVDAGSYSVSIPLLGPADAAATRALFRRWVWYAARRAGLHLDGATDELSTEPAVAAGVARIADRLGIDDAEQGRLAQVSRLERYGAGELVQRPRSIPDGMRFVLGGGCELFVPTPAGERPIGSVAVGEYLGQTALTREPVLAGAVATAETTVLFLPATALDTFLRSHPRLAHELGEAIELRRRRARQALTDAGQPAGSARSIEAGSALA